MSQPFAQNAQKKGLKQMAVIQKFRKSFGKSFYKCVGNWCPFLDEVIEFQINHELQKIKGDEKK